MSLAAPRTRAVPVSPPLRLAPAAWRKEIAGVLITKKALAGRVRELAKEIEWEYAGRDLVVVAVLNGTVLFLADLIRHLALPLRLDFIGVSSYREGTNPKALKYTKELRLDVRGRDVLLVDDILDTGRTFAGVLKKLRRLRPRSIRTCVLLDKPARRIEKIRADYVGFEAPDVFVVGYGLDFAERYRNLPFIAVLKKGQNVRDVKSVKDVKGVKSVKSVKSVKDVKGGKMIKVS